MSNPQPFDEFKSLFAQYIRANSITLTPVEAVGTETSGTEPAAVIAAPIPSATLIRQTYWIWFNSAGFAYVVPMNLLHVSSDNRKTETAGELRRHMGLETDGGEPAQADALVQWESFLISLDPLKGTTPMTQVHPVIGRRLKDIPADLGQWFQNNASGGAYSVGQTYQESGPGGRAYALLPIPGSIGMFSMAWRLLGA